MKNQILGAIFGGLVLPLAVLAAVVSLRSPREQGGSLPETERSAPERENQVMVTVLTDSGPEEMALEGYLVGVVLAEMPANFEMEALKAQAVVARTYTSKRIDSNKHTRAAVCTDSSCCQGYITPEEYLSSGFGAAVEKVRQAVAETAGQVLTYQGALIDATYFSCSGGSTEDAVAVWGTDVPYLQAVDSPGEESAPRHTETVTFSGTEFARLTGCGGAGTPGNWFGPVAYTDGGGVASMVICGKRYTGVELRQMLGLRSTAFAVTVSGNSVVIETRGSGHRVGMSQYGAQAMALRGNTYGEILAHYYQGTTIETRTE